MDTTETKDLSSDIATIFKEQYLLLIDDAEKEVRRTLKYPRLSKEIKDTLRNHLNLIDKARREMKAYVLGKEDKYDDISNLCRIGKKLFDTIYEGNTIKI